MGGIPLASVLGTRHARGGRGRRWDVRGTCVVAVGGGRWQCVVGGGSVWWVVVVTVVVVTVVVVTVVVVLWVDVSGCVPCP